MWNSKPKKFGHRCGKKKKGRPKAGDYGACFMSAYPEIVKLRNEDKRIEREWLTALNLEDVEV